MVKIDPDIFGRQRVKVTILKFAGHTWFESLRAAKVWMLCIIFVHSLPQITKFIKLPLNTVSLWVREC